MNKELVKMLKNDEEFRSKAYNDTMGVLTIGYGRNIEQRGISEREAEYLLINDIQNAYKEAREIYKYFDLLTQNRQNVIINMLVNLGKTRYLTFEKMIDAIKNAEWQKAADEMMDSLWSKQVKDRAKRLEKLMREG